MDNLGAWLQWLEANHPPAQIALGLDRIRAVASRLDCLAPKMPIVTVAGTNGKGSVVSILAKLLQMADLKVGTYTSPHILDFKERIQLNGEPILESDLMVCFARVKAALGEEKLTYFEFTTLAAMVYFQFTAKPDVLILEIGMGGRLDAVNLLTPTLAVITSIGLDHQAYLGDSIDLIAKEKVGIVREKRPVIVGQAAQTRALLAELKKKHGVSQLEQQHFGFDNHGMWGDSEGSHVIPENDLPQGCVSLALAAYQSLKTNLSLPSLDKVTNTLAGLKRLGCCYPVAFQGRTLYLDSAHNGQAAQWLSEKIVKKTCVPNAAIFSAYQDKDIAELVSPMLSTIKKFYVPCLPGARAASQAQLQTVFNKLQVDYMLYPSVKEALLAALRENLAGKPLLVYGSFSLLAELLPLLDIYEVKSGGLELIRQAQVHKEHVSWP